tara:strand:- start:669 stop:884 length:216 start_codon:yes stop_codon:yes gene_type:complete
MSDKVEDILYQAHEEGIWKEVMQVSKSLDNNGKSYYTVADKFEEAYWIVKNKKEKSYENKHLDKKRRGNKR